MLRPAIIFLALLGSLSVGVLQGCVLEGTGYGRACDDDDDCDPAHACDPARGFCVPADAIGGEGEGEGETGLRALERDPVAAVEDAEVEFILRFLGGDARPVIFRAESARGGSATVIDDIAIDDEVRVTYRPAADVNGDDQLTLTPTQGDVDGAGVVVVVEIAPVNDAPVLAFVDGDTAFGVPDVGTVVPFVIASDIDGQTPTLSVDFAIDAANFTVAPAIDDGGVLRFTAAAGRFFSIDGTVSAFDGALGASLPCTIVVEDPGDPLPELVVADVSISEDTPADRPLVTSANGGQIGDDATLSVAIPIERADLIASITENPDGTWRIVPQPNANGVVVVAVVAEDEAGQQTTRNATVTVTAVNDAPTLVLGVGTIVTPEDVPFAGDIVLTASGGPPDEDAALTYDVVVTAGSALVGSVGVDSSGLLSLVPAANANGAGTFQITVVDSAALAGSRITLGFTITAVDDPPSLTLAAPFALTEDTAVPATVVVSARSPGGGNDESSDVVGVDVVVVSGAELLVGPATILANGSLSATLAANRNGVLALELTAVDAGGPGIAQPISFTVGAVNDPPELFPVDVATPEGSSAELVIGAFTDGPFESGQTLGFVGVAFSDPDDVILEANTTLGLTVDGDVTLLPALNAGVAGVFSVSWRLQDDGGGANLSALATSTITVEPTTGPPTLVSQARLVVSEGQIKIGALVAEDLDGSVVSFTVLTPPGAGFGTFDIDLDGAFTFAAGGVSPAVDTVVLRLADDDGETTDVAVTLVIISRQPSCFHLLAQEATNGPGVLGDVVYPLVAGATNYDAFCDMSGGGFTLVMKADGTDDELEFDDARWTDATLLAEDVVSSRNADLVVGDGSGAAGESKLRSYLNVKVDELRVGFAARTTGSRTFRFPGDLTLPINATGPAAASMQTLMSGGFVALASPPRASWLGVDPAFQLQAFCNRVGINVVGDTTGGQVDRLRIGILSNDQNDCDTPDSFVGIGSSLGGTIAGNRSLGGVPSLTRHVAVLVRSNDLTDIGNRQSCDAHFQAGFVVDGFYLVAGTRTFCDQP
ncbi:MAG: tandem-95 repeat protein [Deltaproteobacteria bacterium]|nr:tandem-95 repeat protein [Deltaproteobacteria bacterium]